MSESKLSITRGVYREISVYDENGELLSESVSRIKTNGGGFVISYTEKMSEFLEKTTVSSQVRVFLYIAHHQNYGTDGKTFGYRCSHKYLQQVLRLDRKSVYSALSALKENFLVNESRVDGQIEFMVNPNYVTIGSDKKIRMIEWNRRWEQHWKNVNSKKF